MQCSLSPVISLRSCEISAKGVGLTQGVPRYPPLAGEAVNAHHHHLPQRPHPHRLPPNTGGGLSRLTSRGVSPVKDRSADGGQQSLFASFVSASGTNQGAIDNRIEQAMDLVKSHLMNAVRSEVEELKERIVKLEDVISHLQTENDFLKANVTQEVLTQLPPPTAHHQILQQQGPNAPVSAAPAGSISPIASPLILSSQQQQQPL
eukprot:TRINITY_DN282_c2_g1_i1.p1 TRINITY_DN282_c2_g1~~TRINITY_DN282_c2_g1_i1.p1  ORF type:complete len:205 (+),score=57.31 TRINITY_DN282_c2_g1_i1:116-730(+)